jgi:hypothetical protein
MLSKDRTHVLPAPALRNMPGKHKASQYSAWSRLAHYLVNATPWQTTQAPPALPDAEMRLHSQFTDNLKSTWPRNKTVWKTLAEGVHTDLHTLSGMHQDLERQALSARDQVMQYTEEVLSKNKSGSCVSHRRTVQLEETKVNRRCRTGYAQFVQAEEELGLAKCETQTQTALHKMAQISEKYSHPRKYCRSDGPLSIRQTTTSNSPMGPMHTAGMAN